jgi:hypothetical protein
MESLHLLELAMTTAMLREIINKTMTLAVVFIYSE